MKLKIIISSLALLAIAVLMFLILKKEKPESASIPDVPMHTVKVEEVISGNQYTYLRVKESRNEYWIAVINEEVKVGSKWTFADALLMENFASKELNRTFPIIYFVSELLPAGTKAKQETVAAPLQPSKPNIKFNKDIEIQPVDGSISIDSLFKNQAIYADTKVKVKGQVVKVNNEVMDRNWIHIQDGTEFGGKFDLTVTTTESLKVGDVIIFEGLIHLNKDFGAGYFYELIMEEAKVLKKYTDAERLQELKSGDSSN